MTSSASMYFQVLLLAGACGIASLQCDVKQAGQPCGCNKFEEPCSSDGWTGEDSEYYYLGDMAFRKLPGEALLTLSDYAEPKSDLNPMFWPGGLIFYIIDESFESSFRDEILAAMTTIQTSVGDRHFEFRSARTADGTICRKSYLLVERTDDVKCTAEVGGPRTKKLVTKMWLNQRQCTQGTIQHELLHSLGRLHEQARPDRDQHVTLQPSEIISRQCGNYQKTCRTAEEDPSLRLPYDSNSIMHYGSCYFTCTGRHTLLARGGAPIPENRKKMTDLDILKMRVMYPANSKVPYSDVYCSGCSAAHIRGVAAVLLGLTFHVAMRFGS